MKGFARWHVRGRVGKCDTMASLLCADLTRQSMTPTPMSGGWFSWTADRLVIRRVNSRSNATSILSKKW